MAINQILSAARAYQPNRKQVYSLADARSNNVTAQPTNAVAQPVQPAQPAQQTNQYSSMLTTSPITRDPFSAKPVYASSGGMSNPYLGQQAQAITQQANQNLQYSVLPGINSGAVAAGGYGGSRQGIAQGLAMGMNQQGISNALANMYGAAYSHDQDLANQRDIAWLNNDTSTRNAQIAANASMYGADKSSAASIYGADKSSAASMYGADKSSAASMYGADASREASKYATDKSYALGMGNLGLGYQNSAQNYDLGLRSNDLGFATLDANIANQNFANQLQGANFGLNVYNALQNGNQLGLNAGNNIQNTPLNYYNQFANIANTTGGLGGNANQTGTSTAVGNPYLGALGGAQLGGSLFNNLGFGNNNSNNIDWSNFQPYTW